MDIQMVLHVDDDKTISKIVKIVLEQIAGWQVEHVTSGHDALEFLKHSAPDVVLLDIMMPCMDGTSAFRNMQNLKLINGIPVIFLSASPLSSRIEEFIQMGVAGVIQKPFDPAALPDLIQEIVDSHTAQKVVL